MVTHVVMPPAIELKSSDQNGNVNTEKANFEEAIIRTGFGRFQLRALLSAGLCLYALLCEAACIAFILPAAECDLDMTLKEKGMLSASVFIGFISSAHFWGAVGDVWGRRKTMMFAMIADSISTITSAMAPSFVPLLVGRFFSGVFSCAPSGLLYVYAGEFYDNSRRPRAIIAVAAFGAITMISLPALAMWIIPSTWTFTVPGIAGLPVLTSWRLFLAACALPSVVAAFMLLFCMPESPKFLLESGKHEQALEVLKTIFASNTGKPREEYPIKALVDDAGSEGPKDNKRSICSIVWNQTAPLFGRELLGSTILVSFMQFAAFFGFNPLFLWLPEMFNRFSSHESGTVTLCDVMGPQDIVNSSFILLEEGLAAAGDPGQYFPLDLLEYDVSANVTCDASVDNSAFINTLILNSAAGVSNIVSGFCINFLGKRVLLMVAFIVSGSLTASLSYIRDPTLLLVLYTLGVSIACACPGIIQAVAIDLFPTNLRGMASSLSMMAGRVGVVFGTMTFGALLDVKCELPFLMLSVGLVAGGLVAIKVPAR